MKQSGLENPIRFITESDLQAVTEIYNGEVLSGTATFDTEPRSLQAMSDWLMKGAGRHPSIVALEGGRVVGFASLYPWSIRKAYEGTAEHAVYVRSECRGRGIGKALLQRVLDAGREAGLHTLIARITVGNEASLGVHEKLGFEKIGTMKEVGLKFGKRLDVLLLQFIFPDGREGE